MDKRTAAYRARIYQAWVDGKVIEYQCDDTFYPDNWWECDCNSSDCDWFVFDWQNKKYRVKK